MKSLHAVSSKLRFQRINQGSVNFDSNLSDIWTSNMSQKHHKIRLLWAQKMTRRTEKAGMRILTMLGSSCKPLIIVLENHFLSRKIVEQIRSFSSFNSRSPSPRADTPVQNICRQNFQLNLQVFENFYGISLSSIIPNIC